MTVIKQIRAKEKAHQVIQSCITNEQIRGARHYVENYNKLFSDLVGYSELNRLIFKKERTCLKN